MPGPPPIPQHRIKVNRAPINAGRSRPSHSRVAKSSRPMPYRRQVARTGIRVDLAETVTKMPVVQAVIAILNDRFRRRLDLAEAGLNPARLTVAPDMSVVATPFSIE